MTDPSNAGSGADVLARLADAREQVLEVLTELGRGLGAGLRPLEVDAAAEGTLAAVALGFRVRSTETHHIDVIEQIYNWRVVASAVEHPDGGYVEAYCYRGKDAGAFTQAVLGALVWDGPGHGPPPGWYRNVLTQEYAHREGSTR